MASFEDQPNRRWLSIVGIGEDGADGLGVAARALVERADLVFGGQRHLRLAADLIHGTPCPWPSPFSIAGVLEARGRNVCVLASGDPLQGAVGSTLARHVPAVEMMVIPAPSAFSLAAARLGWPLSDTVTLSLHGKPLDLIRPWLHPGARLLALTSDGAAPGGLARLLTEAGFGT